MLVGQCYKTTNGSGIWDGENLTDGITEIPYDMIPDDMVPDDMVPDFLKQVQLDILRYHRFEVNSGFVALVDVMGDDQAIVDAARISYGRGTSSVSSNRGLIRYLMRHRHTTPFEQVELKFLVYVPMDCWRQWIRHRTANVNEYSTRYSEAITQKLVADSWRGHHDRQGSGKTIEWPIDYVQAGSPEKYLSMRESHLQDLAEEVYEERLDFGVAREQARKDLPLSTFTKAYWKIDLHNLFHFLSLRMDSHAQLEIRQYAETIAKIVESLVPLAWEAFSDYRLNGMHLGRHEIEAIRDGNLEMGEREKLEFEHKLRRLGLG